MITYVSVTYHMTNGAGLFTGVSAGHTRTASSVPQTKLKVLSVKPGGAAGGRPAMMVVYQSLFNGALS